MGFLRLSGKSDTIFYIPDLIQIDYLTLGTNLKTFGARRGQSREEIQEEEGVGKGKDPFRVYISITLSHTRLCLLITLAPRSPDRIW